MERLRTRIVLRARLFFVWKRQVFATRLQLKDPEIRLSTILELISVGQSFPVTLGAVLVNGVLYPDAFKLINMLMTSIDIKHDHFIWNKLQISKSYFICEHINNHNNYLHVKRPFSICLI